MGPDFLNGYRNVLKKHRGLVLFEAILFIILGCLAIAAPVVFTLAADYLFGAFFLAGGLVQLFRTCQTWGMKGSWLSLLGSLITMAAGFILVTRPLVGLIALTTILAVYFLLESAVKFSWAFAFEQAHKFWLFVSALLSLALGILIIAGLPQIATWVIGLFIGIDFLFFGFMLLAFHSALKE